MNAELFAEEVHSVVVQLSDWMKAENPPPIKLMPALAVVLGRVISNQAESEVELKTMLQMAINAMTGAAFESWQSGSPTSQH